MSETDIQLRRIADALARIATQLESGANSEHLTLYDQVAGIVDVIEDPLLQQCVARQKRRLK
jgi:hypothetical protein